MDIARDICTDSFYIDSIAVSVFVDFLTLANTETAVATPLERM